MKPIITKTGPAHVDISKDPNYVLTKNEICFNLLKNWAIVSLVAGFVNLIHYFVYMNDSRIPVALSLTNFALGGSGICLGLFMGLLVFFPKYGAGKPSMLKIWPIVLGAIFYVWVMSKNVIFKGFEFVELVLHVLFQICFTLHVCFTYLGQDKSETDTIVGSGWCFLFYRNATFKPWSYKRKVEKSD